MFSEPGRVVSLSEASFLSTQPSNPNSVSNDSSASGELSELGFAPRVGLRLF